ncbi:hypothetical protein DKX38_003981 [Salix brachista]|uniref:Uncharacterized protein n=1 Tax=Salix brachista TaxID=2182728 RepID=A0A5N5NA96_9ROSI|nr:hypothetical protein DKX38_003981 [Salix brachista]
MLYTPIQLLLLSTYHVINPVSNLATILCKCLGHKFQPYIEVAIPCLLQSAWLTLPDDANIEESDDQRNTEIIESSFGKRLLQKSPFEKLCSDIIPALVEALVKEEVNKISTVMLDSLEIAWRSIYIDQIKRFLTVIMDVLDTSILITEGNEASEQGEKVRKNVCACLKIFMKTYKGSLLQFFNQLLSPMEHMWHLHLYKKVERPSPCLELAFSCNVGFNAIPFLEFKIALDLLCSIVEISKDELLRRDFINLPRIIASFVEPGAYEEFAEVDRITALRGLQSLLIGTERVRACEKEWDQRRILWPDDDTLATKEIVNRVINLLRDFKSSLPSDILSSFLSTLEPSRQNVLQFRCRLSSLFLVIMEFLEIEPWICHGIPL